MPATRALLRLRLLSTLAASALMMLAFPATGVAAPHVPGEVVVGYEPGAGAGARAAARKAGGASVGEASGLGPSTEVLHLGAGESVTSAVHALRRQPGVAYAVPNYIARAAALIPNDPGRTGARGGWRRTQWNFAGPFGVRAPAAWSNLVAAGAPGARGVTVAVVDTGVAYEDFGRYRRSPDFSSGQFVKPYDFVDGDRHANDGNGHGTFVAGVIAERTGNARHLTGLAYGVRVMPIRALDDRGQGDATDISRAIRYATREGAKVINLSLEYDPGVAESDIPTIVSAIRFATGRGVVIVGAAGNDGGGRVVLPARAAGVMAVAGTTEHGCTGSYSNRGADLDIAAPGGGADASHLGDPACRPDGASGRDVFQVTFDRNPRAFGLPSGFVGTSMAAAHVAGAAALVVASGAVGRNPGPATIERRLEATARERGTAGFDTRYGHGLLDAGAATARTTG